MKFKLMLVDETPLVVLFDTLVKVKSVSVPYYLINSFCDYCAKRGKIVMGGIMYQWYQYFYID